MMMNWRTLADLDTASKLYVMQTVKLPKKGRTILFDLIKQGPLIVSAKALGLLTPDELLEIMPTLKRKPELKPFLVSACAMLGSQAEPMLKTFLDDESEYVRKAALQIAGRLKLTGLETKIRRMTGQERIARHAVAALKRLGSDVSLYKNHPDASVRELFEG
jgi:hypothetical protein